LHLSIGWIDLDLPIEQQVHPVSACTLGDLLEASGAFGFALETLRAVDALDELARALRSTLAPLARGDDALIAEVADRRALALAEERQAQRARSVHREMVNGIEILEVPATPDVLGGDAFRRLPDNEPDRGTWFIVATPMGDMVVYTLAAARALAQEFGVDQR
jgi:hypothetical protein